MRLRFFICLLASGAVLSGNLPALAQAPPVSPIRTYSVKFDVLPVLASGYHFSAEKLWGSAYRQALVVTPQLYRGPIHDFTSDLSASGNDRVRGYGLEVQHRLYLNERTTPLAGFYVGYGPHYQHFELQFQANSWQLGPGPDGLVYYDYRLGNQTQTVERYGASVVLGKQFFLPNSPVFLDGYLGLGLRKSSSRATLPGNHYASGMTDYSYEGHYLPIGFRVGVAW